MNSVLVINNLSIFCKIKILTFRNKNKIGSGLFCCLFSVRYLFFQFKLFLSYKENLSKESAFSIP